MAAVNPTFGDDEDAIDVSHVGRLLAANARLIVVVALAFAAIVFVVAHGKESRYRATARIVSDTTTSTTTTGTDTDPRRLATNVALLTTPDVLDAAARKLPGETGASLRDKLSSTAATDADVITVTATDASAAAAAADANAVARAFLESRTANERAAILRTRAALTAQLAGVGKGPSASAQAAAIRTRLSELVVDEANAGNDLQLAEAAEPPTSPYAPRPLRSAILAFVAALFLAALAVVLRDRLRPRASTGRDVERLSGVPVMGALAPGASRSRGGRLDGVERRLESIAADGPPVVRRPLESLLGKRRRSRAARLERARAEAGDGVRSVLGATLLALPPGDRHVILVTSAARGEGSARVAAGLARALAHAGQETLAVSADPASAELAMEFGIAPSPGLAEALERAQAGSAVRLRAATVPGLERLHVVPAGAPSYDGVGLVRPGAVDALFGALGNTGYAYVIVEAPAFLSAPEAWLVARNAEAAIIACPQEPSAEDLAACRRSLERLDVRVLGAVRSGPGPEVEPRVERRPARRQEARPSDLGESPPAASPALLTALPQTVDPGSRDVAEVNGGAVPALEARQVIEHLRTADRPLTFSQLRGALGDPPPARVRARLRQLVDEGDVVRGGSGRKGDPYVYGLSDR